jgi:cytochrome c biogenesis protein CcdA
VHDLLVGGTLLTSFLAGAVALFAPCCISVMLPAYFASSFRRRRALVSMTFVFALGVGTVILPIALGAAGVSRLISGHHTPVFIAGAALMVAMGMATLLGWKLPIPMPGMQARAGRGPAAVWALGAFSGVASACCAPVLAGVIALSGAASSFLVALAVGVAYVFGMVLPLFAIAVLWDRRDWGASSLLRGRTLRIAGRELTVATLASGLILLAMGALTFVLALTGPSMPTGGWQIGLTVRLQHYAHLVASGLSGVPGWVVGAVLVAALGILGWMAIRSHATDEVEPEIDQPPGEREPLVPAGQKEGIRP